MKTEIEIMHEEGYYREFSELGGMVVGAEWVTSTGRILTVVSIGTGYQGQPIPVFDKCTSTIIDQYTEFAPPTRPNSHNINPLLEYVHIVNGGKKGKSAHF